MPLNVTLQVFPFETGWPLCLFCLFKVSVLDAFCLLTSTVLFPSSMVTSIALADIIRIDKKKAFLSLSLEIQASGLSEPLSLHIVPPREEVIEFIEAQRQLLKKA